MLGRWWRVAAGRGGGAGARVVDGERMGGFARSREEVEGVEKAEVSIAESECSVGSLEGATLVLYLDDGALPEEADW